MVIPEDVTFYPQFDYVIQVLAVPCVYPDKFIGGILLDASGETMDLPGGIALAVPTGTSMVCKMNKTTLSVTLMLSGRKQTINMTPAIYDPSLASLYKFTNWNLINEDGSGTVMEDGDELTVTDSAKIVASFMPIISPDTSSVSVAFNDKVSVTNPPSG
ncbi:MAG: hypothetical protein Q4F54_05120 [Coriobacteriia bacterium]|nr:hypothetical protein [Coriobacteriia bacterium]